MNFLGRCAARRARALRRACLRRGPRVWVKPARLASLNLSAAATPPLARQPLGGRALLGACCSRADVRRSVVPCFFGVCLWQTCVQPVPRFPQDQIRRAVPATGPPGPAVVGGGGGRGRGGGNKPTGKRVIALPPKEKIVLQTSENAW